MATPFPGAHVEPQRPTRVSFTYCTRARLHSASANQQHSAAAQTVYFQTSPCRPSGHVQPLTTPIMPRPCQPPGETNQSPSVTIIRYIPCRKLPLVAWWQRLRPPRDQVPAPTPAQAARVLVRCCSAADAHHPVLAGLTRQTGRQCCPTGHRHSSLLVAAPPAPRQQLRPCLRVSAALTAHLPGAGGP